MDQQTIDLKKTVLLFQKNIQKIIIFTIVGAILFAGVYLCNRVLFHSEKLYRVSGDYYITFDTERYPDGVDYYNAFTWDSILRDDPIVDTIMEELPESYQKDEVKNTISGEMLGDYRILTAHVTSENKEEAEEIAKALELSLTGFPEKIDMLKTIEKWSEEPVFLLKEKNLVANAALLGALLGLICSVFIVAFSCILDDGVYVEKDYQFSEKLPYLGLMTKNQNQLCVEEIRSNIEKLLENGKRYPLVHIHEKKLMPGNVFLEAKEISPVIGDCLSLQGEELKEAAQADGLILMAAWGSKNQRMIEKCLRFLEKQECKPVGIIFYEADDQFLRKYYGIK